MWVGSPALHTIPGKFPGMFCRSFFVAGTVLGLVQAADLLEAVTGLTQGPAPGVGGVGGGGGKRLMAVGDLANW